MNLAEHQKIAFDALVQLHQLLQDHNIDHYLLAGSVLGAVRHKGFIPWDDDIDLGIKYEDMEAVEALLLTQPLSGLRYVSVSNDPTYPRLHGKILHNGDCCIDIFPLVRVSDNALLRRWQWCVRKVTWKLYSRKVGYRHPNEKALWVFVSVLLSKLFSRKAILRISDRNCRRYIHKPTQCYINMFSTYSMEKELIQAKCIDQPCELSFHGAMMPVPGFWDEYLTHLYGDYMTPPPEHKRGSTHFETF